MAPKKFNYLFVAAAAAALLLLGAASTVEAHVQLPLSQIHPFCRTSTYKRLCNHMVGNAANWHDASANAMKWTLGLAHRLQTMEGLVKSSITSLAPQSQDSVLRTCRDSFENIVDDMEASLKALDLNQKGTVAVHLSAAYHNDCADALAEFGVSNRYFDHLAKVLHRQVDNCLAVVNQN